MLMYRKQLLSLMAILVALNAICQSTNSSPYSRYAFGDIFGSSNAYYFASGGLNIPMVNFNQVNYGNPASYSYLLRHKPIFSVGVKGKLIQLNTDTDNQKTNHWGLSDFVMGLPIGKKGGAAFGIMPFSTVGYNMADVAYDSHVGNYTYNYSGSGGVNKVFIGASRKLVNRPFLPKTDSTKLKHEFSLSVGANAYYLFGTYTNTRGVDFEDFTYLDSRSEINTQVSDFMFDAGLYFHYRLKNKKKRVNRSMMRKDSTIKANYRYFRRAFDFGAVGSLGSSLNAKRDNFVYTYRGTALAEFFEDTISYVQDADGSLKLPASFGFGAAFIYDQFRLGAQVKLQDWSNYSEKFGNETSEDILNPSYEGAFGIEFQNSSDITNQSKSTLALGIYKLGFRYNKTPLQINNTDLIEIGMSFGLSLPMRFSGSSSMLNFGMEFGERGTTDNNLIQERFISTRIGLTIMPGRFDNWFWKRKYD